MSCSRQSDLSKLLFMWVKNAELPIQFGLKAGCVLFYNCCSVQTGIIWSQIHVEFQIDWSWPSDMISIVMNLELAWSSLNHISEEFFSRKPVVSSQSRPSTVIQISTNIDWIWSPMMIIKPPLIKPFQAGSGRERELITTSSNWICDRGIRLQPVQAESCREIQSGWQHCSCI